MRAQPEARVLVGVLVIGATAACTDSAVMGPRPVSDGATFSQAAAANDLTQYMDAINAQLEAAGANYRAAIAEYVTSPDGGEAGNTVLSKVVGNKQLGHDFVPLDARRAWSGSAAGPDDDITYAIDQTFDAVPPFGGLTEAQTTAAIRAAIASWATLTCTQLALLENANFGVDIGVIAFLNGLGGSPFIFADVQHAGWRDINFAGGILGVTFTFVFVSGPDPTDIDGNRKLDVAFREIYFDPSFSWAVNGSNVDVESIALHEFGHGLSQAHFGTVAFKNDGTLKASPRAVMNALYSGPLRNLLGTDRGGHCSNWASWPNT